MLIDTSIPESIVAVRMNVHTAKPKQPLGHMQMTIPTGLSERHLVVRVGVHAADTTQPLRDLQAAVGTGHLEAVLDSLGADDRADLCKPYLNVTRNKK